MATPKLDILWSPVHQNKFVLWGPDITLYELAPQKESENKASCIKISPQNCAQVVVSQSGRGVRCVDACGDPTLAEPLLALGHNSGKVTLTSLGQNIDSVGLAGREFSSGNQRVCNSVAWGLTEHNLLAAALERNRNDHCILLWDVNKEAASVERPLAEMGVSEVAHHVSWSSINRTLIASMNTKMIKIFDLREMPNKSVQAVSTRYYLTPRMSAQGWRVASRGDGGVALWDMRTLARPLRVIPHHADKILWAPNRPNLLCCLQRDTNVIRLHDVKLTSNTSTEIQLLDNSLQSPTEGEVFSGGASSGVISREVSMASPLHSFVWQHSQKATILAVTNTGGLNEHIVNELVSESWGFGDLAWSSGEEIRALPNTFYLSLNDISHIMKARTKTEYGLKQDLWQNADLANDESLSNLWHFMALSNSLVEDGCIRAGQCRHPGVATVLSGQDAGYRSDAQTSLLPDLPNRRVITYKSAARTCALQLCGWGWGWENALVGIERAESREQWARAAALAAFHLRVRHALDILSRAPHPQLAVVALALAGVSDQRLWRDLATNAMPRLSDPYLRALAAFLSAHPSQPADLQAVLDETEMRLEDRVAFACIYLPDGKLQQYVQTLGETLTHRGDLSGFLITGVGPEGVTLLQTWLETTGDVQSAALIAARTFTPELLQDPRPQHWILSYRSLLDGWKLWWARCALDACLSAANAAGSSLAPTMPDTTARQVMISCGYCSKTVASPGGPPRTRPALSRIPPPAAKMKQISACPHCRKPLPRCGVCVLHLGAGSSAHFPTWLSWCAACRHGGHAQHLISWFQEHTECPITSCNCRCLSLDPPDRLSEAQ